MQKPRARWWGYVRAMIRDYPKLRLQQGSPCAPPLSRDDQRVVNAVQGAIQAVERTPNGPEKLKLIRYMYWSAKNIPGKTAALHLGISEITAKRWHGSFVREVARCYGFSVPESPRKVWAVHFPPMGTDQND